MPRNIKNTFFFSFLWGARRRRRMSQYSYDKTLKKKKGADILLLINPSTAP
jgi:hypothetical protein